MMATMTENTNGQGRAERNAGLVDRAAVRFVLDRRLGRLLADDPRSGDPVVVPVHYVPDGRGNLLTTIPATGPLAEAIRQTGRATLSVTSHPVRPAAVIDPESDLMDVASIWHVQVAAETDLITDEQEVREVLRRQIEAVLEPMPQADKSDPLTRAARTTLSRLIGVRLRVTGLRAQVRHGAERTEDDPAVAGRAS